MNSLCEANPCHAKAKSLSNYPDLTIDWKKLYSLAFETMLYAKLREFQYKILNLIIFTNKKSSPVQIGGIPIMCLLECRGRIPSFWYNVIFCSIVFHFLYCLVFFVLYCDYVF